MKRNVTSTDEGTVTADNFFFYFLVSTSSSSVENSRAGLFEDEKMASERARSYIGASKCFPY